MINIGDLWIHWYHFPRYFNGHEGRVNDPFWDRQSIIFVFHGMIMTRNAWYSYQWTWPQTGRNHGLPSSNEAWQRNIHHLVGWFSEEHFHIYHGLSSISIYFYWSLHGVPNFIQFHDAFCSSFEVLGGPTGWPRMGLSRAAWPSCWNATAQRCCCRCHNFKAGSRWKLPSGYLT